MTTPGSFEPEKGKTLLIQSGPQHDPDRKHLFVIVAGPDEHDNFVLVPICSIEPGVYSDPACNISASEHPFITHDSYAFYARARVAHRTNLKTMTDGWTYFEKQAVDPALFAKLVAGAASSRHAPRWAKTAIRRSNS
jgi:hypothetical protein